MERKIGEIFKYNGEWYQCIIGNRCRECDFSSNNITCDIHGTLICTCKGRSDETSVVFKKLEKVGEPFIGKVHIQLQRYKIYTEPIIDPAEKFGYVNEKNTIAIEIKETKENMEEKNNAKHSNSEKIGKNLKPFSLEAAKLGKPVCTRDGRKARIICFDKRGGCPIIALVETFVVEYDCIREETYYYTIDGREIGQNAESKDDLMMLPEKKEGWVNVYYNRTDGITFSKHPYPSKEEAIKNAGTMSNIIDTVNISWKE